MLTVRFPTGVSVTYNTANYLHRENDVWRLYTAKDGEWVASISPASGCLVEAIPACKVENPTTDANRRTMLLNVVKHLREYSYMDFDLLIQLKRELKDFDAKARGWK